MTERAKQRRLGAWGARVFVLTAWFGLGSGCFYGVASLSTQAESGAAGNNGNDAGDGGYSSSGSAGTSAGTGGIAGASAGGDANCAPSDLDCDYRLRCTNSALLPRLFVGGQAGPYAVAADKNAVYWSDRDSTTPSAGRVRRREVTGGATVDLAVNQSDPGLLVLDESFVYWTSADGTVARVAKDGSAADAGALDVIASGQRTPSGLAVDDTSVYWLSRGGTAVLRRSKEEPRVAPQSLVKTEAKPAYLTQDAADLYWTTGFGFVQSVSKQGAAAARTLVTPELISSALGPNDFTSFEAAGIALDANWVYFRARGLRVAPLKDGTGKLFRVQKDGRALELLFDNRLGGIAELWLDASKLYFTTGNSGGEVWRVANDGGGAVLLNCQIEAYPSGVTTAGNRVYWTNFTGATLNWAPK